MATLVLVTVGVLWFAACYAVVLALAAWFSHLSNT